jgi:hypothetical protein
MLCQWQRKRNILEENQLNIRGEERWEKAQFKDRNDIKKG